MNFYMTQYKKQWYNSETDVWENTQYFHQRIVVVAEDWDAAVSKIRDCLSKVETGNYRAVQVGDVVSCIGLDFRQGFEGSFSVKPIK